MSSTVKTILLSLFLLTWGNVLKAQTLNDGGVRVKVWLHKMWSNASCVEDDINFLTDGADHVWKNIQIRLPNGNGGFDNSAQGLSMYFEGYGANRWMRIDEADELILGGLADIFFPMEDPAIKGRKIQ